MRETKELLKVSIVPKGEWKSNYYYDRLSLVTYNNSAYLAYSPCIGIEPGVSTGWQQYWMLLIESTSIDNANAIYQETLKTVNGIENMTVSAKTLPADAEATATKTYNPQTGMINIEFGIPTSVVADVSNDTVTPDVLFAGYTAHNRLNEKITGTYTPSADSVNYVAGNPQTFTLYATGWNGTSYNLDLSSYPNVSGNIVIGVPPASSMYNAELMAQCALSISQVYIYRNSDTGVVSTATAYISAVTQPTEDLLITIWGL